MPDMDETRAVGFLIAGNVNMLLMERDYDERDISHFVRAGVEFKVEDLSKPACCPICCGPCAALKWLGEHRADDVNEALRALSEGPGDLFDWQLPDGSMNWDIIQDAWSRVWSLGCEDMHEKIEDLAGLGPYGGWEVKATMNLGEGMGDESA